MKTIHFIIALAVIAFSFNQLSAQETNISAAMYDKTIQPITINSISGSYESVLRTEYNNLLGMFLADDDIMYKRKVEMTGWEATVINLQNNNKSGDGVAAYLIFPKGVITIDKDFNTVLSLHENFNKWAGLSDKWWNIFGTDLRHQYTYNR